MGKNSAFCVKKNPIISYEVQFSVQNQHSFFIAGSVPVIRKAYLLPGQHPLEKSDYDSAQETN